MSILRPIQTFKTGTYAYTRPSDPTYIDGIASVTQTAQTPVDAIVTPVTGATLLSLPEATRTEETVKITCATRIELRDVFTLSGTHSGAFVVVKADYYNHRGRTWTEAYAAKQVTP